MNGLFVINRKVYMRDKLREANLFSASYSSKSVRPMEEGHPSGRPLLAVCKKRVKSDIHLSYRELSLIHWFLLSSLSKHSFHTFFFLCQDLFISQGSLDPELGRGTTNVLRALR